MLDIYFIIIRYVLAAVTLLPVNPEDGKGWKSLNKSSCTIERTGKQFFECLEDKAYSSKDILQTIFHPYVEATKHFESVFHGFSQSLEIKRDISSEYLSIPLMNVSVYALLRDPKLQFMTASSETMKRTLLTVESNMGVLYVYLKV